MADKPEENGANLTGLWQGLFSYPRLLEPSPFVAILIESGNCITGTTHEPARSRSGVGGLLYAMIEGRRSGSSVAFVKTYDGTGGRKHSVDYEGRLNGDGTEIEGRWRISRSWSGKFLMLRAGSEARAEKREAAEPVGRQTAMEEKR
jgi:hypothetical protein